MSAAGEPTQPTITDEMVEYVCEVMHDAYEKAAVESGWLTQERSRVPWADVPEANKATMRIAVRAALAAAYPVMIADYLEHLAANIYNADPDPAFPQRQSFYNEGVNPWLMEKARIVRAGGGQ